ncbi:MAG: acetyltransferase [Chromatiaceae bacterium]|nr:acetyltransferase [Chromatiaceae bacterium]
MTHYDVFNGDADGLCALQQLRLAEPVESILVTGVKRDIALLERVEAGEGDRVTVLDVSLDVNRAALLRLLGAGAWVRYVDHHYPGEIPAHPHLDARIDTSPDKGTSLIVDGLLDGAHRAWAVVGTFGDNFEHAARQAAEPLGLAPEALEQLRELGILLNYNGYGPRVEDLHVAPERLFRAIQPHANPFEFIAADPLFVRLREGYTDDLSRARALSPELVGERHRLYILPDAPWARRASGVLANDLAQAEPRLAHAMLTRLDGGGFLVSVRAPLVNPDGADALCRQFDTGGGRRAAAGINHLPEADYDRFVGRFLEAF